MTPRFDAYSATTESLKPTDVVPWFMTHAGDTVHMGRGFHTFAERIWVQDDSGSQVGAVQWGGRQGDRIMVEVKGARTPPVVEQLRQAAEVHRCTRVDACVDFEHVGAWDELLGHVMAVKADHDLYGERRGDWDKPEFGRTQYLGANSSAVRARLYEKGKEPDMRHLSRPDLVRLEVQVRPAKEAKETFAKLSAAEVWGASKWSRDLAGRALEASIERNPAGAVWRQTTTERRLRFLARQYGPTLIGLAHDLGSWECVGLTLRDYVQDEKRRRGR
jgi:DNA relaxase NicK